MQAPNVLYSSLGPIRWIIALVLSPLFVRLILLSVSLVGLYSAICALPSFHTHSIRVQNHFCKASLPPVTWRKRLWTCEWWRSFSTTSPPLSSTARPESSTQASSLQSQVRVLCVLLQEKLWSSDSMQLKITSDIADQKCGEPPLPCPVPNNHNFQKVYFTLLYLLLNWSH